MVWPKLWTHTKVDCYKNKCLKQANITKLKKQINLSKEITNINYKHKNYVRFKQLVGWKENQTTQIKTKLEN